MKWETRKTIPAPDESVIESGPIRVAVSPAYNNHSLRWQYFTVTLGHHSGASHAECLQTWPREAIAKARAALDEFEAELEGEADVMP